MNWTKTVKSFAVLLLLALVGLTLLYDLGNIIFHHYSVLSTLINFVRDSATYAIRVGALLVLVEISENVYAIKNGKSGD